MTETPDMQVQLVSSHGMLAILEVLEGRCSRDVIMKLLQIINLVRYQLPCTEMIELYIFCSWSRKTSAFLKVFV
jgi:hypothetical protein